MEGQTRNNCLFVCDAVDVNGLIILIDDSHVAWKLPAVMESSCLHFEVMLADVVLTPFTLDDGSPMEATHLLVGVG
jgi:hypothetical protein